MDMDMDMDINIARDSNGKYDFISDLVAGTVILRNLGNNKEIYHLLYIHCSFLYPTTCTIL